MVERELRYRKFLSPRYWPTWLALAGAKMLSYLPLNLQHVLGWCAGMLAYRLSKRRRFITETNIQHCFPALSQNDRRTLVKASFISNGLGLFEAFRSWFRRPKSLKSKVSYHGHEHLMEGLSHGKGVILFGGHFSTLDLAGNLTTLYFKADVMQRDHKNGLFNALMTNSRDRLYGKVLSKFDVRGLVQSLKSNHVVWYATDQDYGRTGSVFAPFFGVPAATLISTMRLAEKTGAAVVPFSHFRRPHAKGYDLYIHPPLDTFPSGDQVADATRLNEFLEREIAKHPEQYLWMHRRFKTPVRPATKNIYGQLRDTQFKT
jgi:KDO2-lipid IV(A) lauroyltransferase